MDPIYSGVGMEDYVESIDERRILVLLKTLCIIPLFIFPGMIAIHYMQGAYYLCIVEIVMLAVLATLLYFLYKPNDVTNRTNFLKLAAEIYTGTISIALIFALIFPTHYTAFTLLALVISLIFFLLGMKRGFLIASLLTAISISVFYFKISTGMISISLEGQLNIIILIIMTFILGYFNEQAQHEYAAALLMKNNELQELSNLDGLTQLYNRRYFDSQLRKEWSRLQRGNLYLSVILCDIDNFKQFNDIEGHQAGDLSIQKVAACLNNLTSRVADTAARYGGEEFVILLPQMNAENAYCFSQKIMIDIESLQIKHPGYENKLLTLSIGVSTLIPTQDLAPELIVSLAYSALYISKNDGRNRITIKKNSTSM